MSQTRPSEPPGTPGKPAPLGTPSPRTGPLRGCPPGRCARTGAVPIAEVVARCATGEVRTPTQYVARWTEVAVVARERGHLTGQTELSFDRPAEVDADRR